MHRMNDSSGNAVTQLFAWIATFAAGVGISTQDVVYMFFGAVGLVVSLASYANGRLDARRERKEEQKRTQMLSDYLNSISDKPAHERPAAVSIAIEALKKAGD